MCVRVRVCLQRRTPSRPSTPIPSRPAAPPPSRPSYTSPPAAAFASSGADLERLADFISSNYMGMGKTAMDALPELRRKGITAVGAQLFSLNGVTMSAIEVAEALRLQVSARMWLCLCSTWARAGRGLDCMRQSYFAVKGI